MVHSGPFRLQNPQKYLGIGKFPFYKSGLEYAAFRWLDINKKVISWGYEILKIPYVNPFDKKIHKYYVDIFANIIDNDGKPQKFIAEVKSTSDMRPPVPPKTNNKRSSKYHRLAVYRYGINVAKWKAAEQYAKQLGMKFIFLTERELTE